MDSQKYMHPKGFLVSMIMFSTFEYSVDMIYMNVVKRRKEECSRGQQLGVTCIAGYTAGAIGTVMSNPADNVVSSLYNKKAAYIKQAVRSIGLVNLFTRSLPIRSMIVGPVVTLQWFLYDSIKLLNGLNNSIISPWLKRTIIRRVTLKVIIQKSGVELTKFILRNPCIINIGTIPPTKR